MIQFEYFFQMGWFNHQLVHSIPRIWMFFRIFWSHRFSFQLQGVLFNSRQLCMRWTTWSCECLFHWGPIFREAAGGWKNWWSLQNPFFCRVVFFIGGAKEINSGVSNRVCYMSHFSEEFSTSSSSGKNDGFIRLFLVMFKGNIRQTLSNVAMYTSINWRPFLILVGFFPDAQSHWQKCFGRLLPWCCYVFFWWFSNDPETGLEKNNWWSWKYWINPKTKARANFRLVDDYSSPRYLFATYLQQKQNYLDCALIFI